MIEQLGERSAGSCRLGLVESSRHVATLFTIELIGWQQRYFYSSGIHPFLFQKIPTEHSRVLVFYFRLESFVSLLPSKKRRIQYNAHRFWHLFFSSIDSWTSLIQRRTMSASSGANKRLITEITKLKALSSSGESPSVKFLLDKSPIDDASGGSRTGPASATQNVILGRILPSGNVYNQGAFQIELKLPAEFPFKPPEVRFVTPIYHPNVDDQGKICVDLLNSSETWKPTTPLVDVVKAVIDLIDNPKIDHALNPGRFSQTWHSTVNQSNRWMFFPF